MAELVFFSGTMDCGKSTLALQTDHNHSSRGRAGLVFTQMDRAGASVLSSRLGLRVDAIEVTPDRDLRRVVVDHLSAGGRLDYLICDEAQFYTPGQIEQLARLTGISGPALSLIETGKRDPRLTTLKRIADALRAPLATIIADGSHTAEPSAPAPSGGYDLGEYQ